MMQTSNHRRRHRERGSAMLVTMLVVTALITGGAMLVSVQLSSTKSSDLTRRGLSSFYCAEAGLAAARQLIATNYVSWRKNNTTNQYLCETFRTAPDACPEADFLAAGLGSHDLDGDNVADFVVYLHDNDDELAGANDLSVDTDKRVFLVSRCIKNTETPKVVSELVEFSGGISCIGNMSGGPDGDGNANGGC
jgi:hypothetical protein